MVALESLPLFAEVPSAELKRLQEKLEVVAFPSRHQIFSEGDEGKGMYVVGKGAVQISALVNQSERRVLTEIGPGDFFGELAVLDNEPRSATATTEGETELYFIPKGAVLELLERCPATAILLVREISHRIRDSNRKYIQEVLQAERLALVGRFASSIVHDFKNPLNVIGIAADLAMREKASEETRRSAGLRIRKQVERLTNMINELLEFTRGSQSSIVLAETFYPTFVRRVVEEIRSEVEVKQVKIEFDNEPPEVSLLLDPARLTHVFYNLVHNAVDAMPDGGKVKLRFMTTGKRLRTEIADTGPGISDEIMPRMFEAFATYGKSKGTGLGLSICQKIINDHQGEMDARNEPGEGAVFGFTLPLKH